MTDSYEAGKALSETYNPGMEAALKGRYDDLVPGLSRSIVDFAWGQHYAREGLDIKTRWLATIAALTALGGQTRPQLKVNVAAARRAGQGGAPPPAVGARALGGGGRRAVSNDNIRLRNLFYYRIIEHRSSNGNEKVAASITA